MRATIGKTLEEQFAFLMTKLKHRRHVARWWRSSSRRPPALPSLENARLAAAGKITSEERKAEGLAD